MKRITCQFGLTAVVFLSVAGVIACTTKKQEAPPLTGPSEFGTSISVSITPDVITQDGASQSLITITARDPNGQPLRNVSLRVETLLNGQRIDVGSLSARTVVTGSDGKATLTFTAPPGTVNGTQQIVTIAVTPLGSDANSAVTHTATVRLVPQGIIIPPSGLVAVFTFSPPAPAEDTLVLFDASTSRSNTTIASYTWNFGNGRTGSGATATTVFEDPGSYFVTLTIRDELGRSVSTTNTVTVTAGAAPSAAFDFSPTDPRTGQPVNFNGARSTAATGRRIVSYAWDFGDGNFGTGQTPSHSYALPRTYTVVLTVTDDTGRTASASNTVTVVASTN
jgi:PKD repeat protein